jgi:hypothetical protein
MKVDEMGGACSMLHVWGEEQLRTEVWLGKLREREHLEDISNDGDIIFI